MEILSDLSRRFLENPHNLMLVADSRLADESGPDLLGGSYNGSKL